MTIHRYISIFLTLCFSVFLGHNLIPHHHHSEQVNVPVSSKCPVDHGDTHEHHHDADHEPLHCHAFNDVVFDKYNSSQVRKISQLVVKLSTRAFPALLTSLATEVSSRNVQIRVPHKSSYYFGARSLRAPPVVA